MKSQLSKFLKTVQLFVMLYLFCPIPISADNNTAKHAGKEQAQKWIAEKKTLGFLENKGQMVDDKGNAVPFILFKVEVPNLNIWVTNTGITYHFFKIEEDHTKKAGNNKQLTGNHQEEEEEIKGEWRRVDMLLKGACIKKENIIAEGDITQGDVSFYLAHCPNGIFNVKTYAKIIIKNIYPGIDWILYTSPASGRDGITEVLKHDFIVHPGANPQQIKLIYEGSGKLTIKNNQIHFENELGSVTEGELMCYQRNLSKTIASNYTLKETGKKISKGFSYEVAIQINNYNPSETLIIDPQLVWATFYGGNAVDGLMSADVDKNGNVFVTGYSNSTNFPVQNAGTFYQGTLGGGGYSGDVFILKFNNAGICLWATYYGGISGDDQGNFITTDPFGNVFVTGWAGTGFPVWNAGTFFQGTYSGGFHDAFILKFSNTGSRLWATYYGGSSDDRGYSVTTDGSGNVFVTGSTGSTNFPVQNAGTFFQGTNAGGDAFILKFNNTGTRLWATYYGGSGWEEGYSIAADGSGNVFVTGKTSSTNFPIQNASQPVNAGFDDVFILKFDNIGNRLWATYYGGMFTDEAFSIIADSGGNIFITGFTNSNNFPIQNAGTFFQPLIGGIDAFILKFDNTGMRLWATYLGGTDIEYPNGLNFFTFDNLAIDNCGNVYVSFTTASTDLPTQSSCDGGYNDSSNNGGPPNFTQDVAIYLFDNFGNRLWATYLGGSGADYRNALAVDANSNLFVTGEWTNYLSALNSSTYPLVNPGGGAYYNPSFNGGQDDGYIVKFTTALSVTAVSSPAGCACTGTASATVTGGCVGSYKYAWYNSSWVEIGKSPTITNLCAGNYWVVVKDSISCAKADTATITVNSNSSGLILTSVQTNICSATCTGSATITAGGGVTPYSYIWSNGTTSQTATNLCIGLYSATVTDAGNCTAALSINITQIPAMLLSSATQWSCANNTATTTINVTNGNGTYTYLWSNAGTTQTVSGLNTGTYTITITNKYGCTTSLTVNINPQPLVISISATNIACNSGGNTNNGSVTANINSGGTSPYTYSWSNGFNGQLQGAVGPGSYTVTVTDSNGCIATASTTITSASSANAAYTQSPGGTVCIGATVNFTHTGTTGGDIWNITPPSPAAVVSGTTVDFSFTFLTAGTYTISHEVTTGGCKNTVSSIVTVLDCANPSVTATGSSICPGSCGSVTSSGSGGTAPYTYSWNNGATSQNINPCPASTTTYTVTITDTGGASSTSTATVSIHPAVNALASSNNINCNGANNGSATVNLGGGTPPYIYSWSAGGQITPTVSGLTQGNYTVKVTDGNGCTATATASINEPPPLRGQFTKGTANCTDCGCKEWLMITATGGTSPYTYSWPDGYTNRYKNQLCPGTHTININDKNGCNIIVNLNAP